MLLLLNRIPILLPHSFTLRGWLAVNYLSFLETSTPVQQPYLDSYFPVQQPYLDSYFNVALSTLLTFLLFPYLY